MITLGTLAEHLNGDLSSGDRDLAIRSVKSLREAGPGDVAVVFSQRLLPPDFIVRASALVVPADVTNHGSPLIRVQHPKRALIELLRMFEPRSHRPAGIEPGAHVSAQAFVSAEAFVAAGARIEAGASIGARAQIYANCWIGEGVSIGDDTILFPNVSVYPDTSIGRAVRIHSGTVIGSDGFGYDRNEAGIYEKIPQLGRVIIEDEVEIGANCAIDRATLETTRIGRGTRIDNLVQIGHNSQIGEHCCLISQVGISGSVEIGDHVVISGQAGVSDHVKIGDHVVVGAQAGVHADLPSGLWLGTPAMPVERARRVFPVIEHLPEYRERVRTLERLCERLAGKVEALERTLASLERDPKSDQRPTVDPIKSDDGPERA